MTGPAGGEWVYAPVEGRRRDVPVRCGCGCGALGTDFATWTYWVGLVAHLTLRAECAEKLMAQEEE